MRHRGTDRARAAGRVLPAGSAAVLTALLSLQDEISELKAEGNLEAVLNALDKIVAEGEEHREPAW